MRSRGCSRGGSPRRPSPDPAAARAWIDVLAPIAVGPAVEAALAHRGQVVGHEIRADLVALVHHRPELVRCRAGWRARWGCAGRSRKGCARRSAASICQTMARSTSAVHAALGDVAVGADADIEKAPVGAGGQRLGPVMVDRRRQVGDLDRRPARPGSGRRGSRSAPAHPGWRRRAGRRPARGRRAR